MKVVDIQAVALGAKVIEKHITLDPRMTGPDHAASIGPKNFKKMVDGIRNIEKALGDGHKRPSTSELKNLNAVRKSIVAAADIKLGEKLTNENLTIKRPGSGLSPMLWDDIIGKISTYSYQVNDFIKKNDLINNIV